MGEGVIYDRSKREWVVQVLLDATEARNARGVTVVWPKRHDGSLATPASSVAAGQGEVDRRG